MSARLRVIAVVALLLALIIAAPACGDEDDTYVGYWGLAAGAADETPDPVAWPPVYELLEVRAAGDSYELRFNTLPWWPAEVVDGRLQPQLDGETDAMVTLGIEVEAGGKQATISISPSPSAVTLTRLTEAEYRAKLDAIADEELPMIVFLLAEAIGEWARQHEGSPPAPAEMRADSEFGSYVDERMTAWPSNPFTGEPIAVGTEPGDLSYTTDGRDFTLTAYDSSGALVSP